MFIRVEYGMTSMLFSRYEVFFQMFGAHLMQQLDDSVWINVES